MEYRKKKKKIKKRLKPKIINNKSINETEHNRDIYFDNYSNNSINFDKINENNIYNQQKNFYSFSLDESIYNKEKIKNEINDEDEEQKEEEEEEEDEEENEINDKKCSLDEHNEIEAIYYCQECKIKMCYKCEKVHSGLLKNHHIYSSDKNLKEIFTGLCTIPNHSLKLQFYCKTHNELCCAACLSKINMKGNGQHKDCDVYYITKIKNEKKLDLDKNINYLEELSYKLEPSINELISVYEKIIERKDKIKQEIQNIFTKIRAELNSREDKLYLEIDEKFNELFFKEDLIKASEKLTNFLKTTLEEGKKIKNEWKMKHKLNRLINDCIKVDNSIKNINSIYEKIKLFNSNKDRMIRFYPKNVEMEKGLLTEIRNFGVLKVKKKKINKLNKSDNEINSSYVD